MASGQWATIVDVANVTGPDGRMMLVAEMLSQCNEFLEDLTWVEANSFDGHSFAFRTSIPAGFFRQYNQGTPYGKATSAKARVGLAMLTDYSQIDKALARHSGDSEGFRENQDVAFLEGMGQTVVQTFFYGNSVANPTQWSGLSTFYNSLDASVQNSANVINGGGTGSSNTSLWLVGHSQTSIFGLFPRGSQAGLITVDHGDTQRGYDNVGNPFEAYTTYFEQEAGLCPQDWRYGVRLCNLDTTSAGLAGPNAPDLFVLMDQMVREFPKFSKLTSGVTKTDAPTDPTTGVRGMFYANRTLHHWMSVQAMRNRNVLLTLNDYDGRVVDTYRGIGIKNVDQLSNAEAAVT